MELHNYSNLLRGEFANFISLQMLSVYFFTKLSAALKLIMPRRQRCQPVGRAPTCWHRVLGTPILVAGQCCPYLVASQAISAHQQAPHARARRLLGLWTDQEERSCSSGPLRSPHAAAVAAGFLRTWGHDDDMSGDGGADSATRSRPSISNRTPAPGRAITTAAASRGRPAAPRVWSMPPWPRPTRLLRMALCLGSGVLTTSLCQVSWPAPGRTAGELA
jgi:hypothetical protein